MIRLNPKVDGDVGVGAVTLLLDHAEDGRVIGAAGVEQDLVAVLPQVPRAVLLDYRFVTRTPLRQHPKVKLLVILHVNADRSHVLGLSHPLIGRLESSKLVFMED